MTRATLQDAIYFVSTMSLPAQHIGYVLAPYGSTILAGEGRDVDVIAVPWRPPCDWRTLLRVFAEYGFPQQGECYFGLMGTCAAMLELRPGGPLVDLMIREVPQTEDVLRQVRRVMETDAAGWR